MLSDFCDTLYIVKIRTGLSGTGQDKIASFCKDDGQITTSLKAHNIFLIFYILFFIYEINCHTCNLKYIGQTSREILTRFKEHRRYIRQNNPQSAYALHILNNQHEFGPARNTIKLIKQCNKHRNSSLWENFYIQNYSRNHQLINEQSKPEYNILYDLHTYN